MARQHVAFRDAEQGLPVEPAIDETTGQRQAPAGEWRRLLPSGAGGGLRILVWLLVKLIFAFGVTVVVLLHWDIGAALFVGLLLCSISGLVDGRVSVVVGLIGIASCPLLIIADQQAWLQKSTLVNYYIANAGIVTLNGAADQMAVWAYYFLCIGAVAQVARYAQNMVSREKRRKSE